MHHTRRKPIALAGTAVLTTLTLVLAGACSSGSGGGGETTGSSTTYTWWDPYPQHDKSSDWEARVQQCGQVVQPKVAPEPHHGGHAIDAARISG